MGNTDSHPQAIVSGPLYLERRNFMPDELTGLIGRMVIFNISNYKTSTEKSATSYDMNEVVRHPFCYIKLSEPDNDVCWASNGYDHQYEMSVIKRENFDTHASTTDSEVQVIGRLNDIRLDTDGPNWTKYANEWVRKYKKIWTLYVQINGVEYKYSSPEPFYRYDNFGRISPALIRTTKTPLAITPSYTYSKTSLGSRSSDAKN